MRTQVSSALILLIAMITSCMILSLRSKKRIALSVFAMLASLMPPVAGNLVVILSENRLLSVVGLYMYFLSMDFVMYALLLFTEQYCSLSGTWRKIRCLLVPILLADVLQLLCNPVFHHAFGIERLLVDGKPYYRMLPFIGQRFHRILDYGIFAAVLIAFFMKMTRSSRIYFEKYAVIFFTMVFTGFWETYYIFSRTPVDKSMIGFGVFGLLAFYFSLYYRPMRLLDSMLAKMVEEMPAAVFFFDAQGMCVWANDEGLQLAGIRDNNYEQAGEALENLFGRIEPPCRRTTGTGEAARIFELRQQAVADRNGITIGSCLNIRDDTLQQRELRKEKFNATHDSLTGIYNKEYLFTRVKERVQDHPPGSYCVAYLDINNFKLVNDVFGREFGDSVLCQVADSFRHNLPEGFLYGRLSGDTFGLCLPVDLFDEDYARYMLSDYKVSNGTLVHHLVMNQGVYVVTEPDLDVSAMFDRAHLALNTVKGDYKTCIAWYDEKMRRKILWSQEITSQLNDALENGEIRPYLQELVDAEGRLIGAEALVRWEHPVYGYLEPSRFVPVLEDNGLIAEVDRFMWRSACRILRHWNEMGHRNLFISVNISPKDFYFMDVVRELVKLTQEYGVTPSGIRTEITETVMMTDNEQRLLILNELKEKGFIVEMDDFGSGYSSLNMLKDMPVDVIKIDRLFLRQTLNDIRSQVILKNIIKLTEELNIGSLTEGVETREQYRMLSEMGCRMFQGYYFSKPLPEEEFEQRFL